MNKKKTIITTTILLLLGSIAYYLNKHIVTVTDYSKGGIKETIFVFDLSKVKKIPNYENYAKDTEDDGMELVFEKDYERYHQGYCLKENRILSDEEIYKKAIIQELKGEIDYYKYKLYAYDLSAESCHAKEVGYYLLNSDINATNWYEKFRKHHNPKKEFSLEKMFFETFKAKPIDIDEIIKYVVLDFDTMTASLKKPIVLSDGFGNYGVYIGKVFELYKNKKGDKHGIDMSWIFLIRMRKIGESEKIYYEHSQKEQGSNEVLRGDDIDNCGNLKFNAVKYYYWIKEQV